MMKEISISSKERYQLIDITGEIENLVVESGVREGIVFVFAPHSTAGILLTENEENLKEDWLELFEKLVSGLNPEGEQAPYGAGFKHNLIDDNADSHLLSGLLGQERVLLIENGNLIRGTWQQIFLAEFDGPRRRKVIVKILKG
ncbi:secondary thiamine-phosphate synthase enzyme YjbQ [Patescibacteria group bacterium]|nr:secondary thiamine-phosphate synthase enzyme YjbQ [Patescibacteria group bacterium]MBU4481481.1 secondary thiamine-phosphate synthase enzyme YjbQ [Patescibacteria group bacterium]